MTATEPSRGTIPTPSAAGAPVDPAALRLARTPMDMVKAVAILLVPVLIAVFVYVFFFGGSNVIVIDPSGTYAQARASAHFTVLEPAGLPAGWRPVSSAYQMVSGGSVLRVGYVAPDGAGIQLVESDRPSDAFIADEIGGIQPVVTSVQAGSRMWGQVNAGQRTDRALIDTQSSRTVIIMGQAGIDEMRAFAAALR